MAPIPADIEYVRLAPALGEDEASCDPQATWDFNAIGWLLDEVKQAGGEIPRRYYRKHDTQGAYGDTPEDLMAMHADFKSVREARDVLGRKIRGSFTWEKSRRESGSEARRKKRPEVAAMIKARARRLSESLQEDSTLMQDLATEMGLSPFTGVVMGDFMDLLKALEQAAGKMENKTVSSAPFPQIDMTPQELLFSRLLTAYREGLDADPTSGYSASHHDPKGPFVAFAKAAHKLAGKDQPSSDALESAMKTARGAGSGED
ncbi:hypothetical protein [Xanthobacter versatilis]|uniref:hypothetical protein n=1 Tax=Xanthobacter autotrophicus (strain ATCC BAA-1158 / Py2) TaxID=78245 RepID=UPI00372C4105